MNELTAVDSASKRLRSMRMLGAEMGQVPPMESEQETKEPLDTGLDPWEVRVEATLAVIIGSRQVALMNRTWDEELESEHMYISFSGIQPDLSTQELMAVYQIAKLADPALAQLQAHLQEAAEKELEPI